VGVDFLVLTATLLAVNGLHAIAFLTLWGCGKRSRNVVSNAADSSQLDAAWTRSHNTWSRRLRASVRCCCCTCCAAPEALVNDDMVAVAGAVAAAVFHQQDVLNLTPSDISAGMTLLHHPPRAERPAGGAPARPPAAPPPAPPPPRPLPSERAVPGGGYLPLDPTVPAEAAELRNAAYYMGYALAEYGPACYIWTDCASACGTCCMGGGACAGGTCCADCGSVGDGCGCGAVAVRATIVRNSARFPSATGRAAVGWNDVLHVSYANDVGHVPFSVTADAARGCVVVAARGTMSFVDALTDALALPVPVADALGDRLPDYAARGVHLAPGDLVVHKGIWAVASSLATQLEVGGYLAAACAAAAPGTPPADVPIVVTGHSLGAGVASLLTFLLLPRYARVKAYAFAPPAAAMSAAMAAAMEPWITSVVVGDDCVPRLSVASCRTMMLDVTDCLATADASKAAILLCDGCCARLPAGSRAASRPRSAAASAALSSLAGTDSKSEPLVMPDATPAHVAVMLHRAPTYGTAEVPGPDCESGAAKTPLVASAGTGAAAAGLNAFHTTDMAIPGRILHLARDDDDVNWIAAACSVVAPCIAALLTVVVRIVCCCATRRTTFAPRWASRDSFAALIVGSDMVVDHFPDSTVATLRAAAAALPPLPPTPPTPPPEVAAVAAATATAIAPVAAAAAAAAGAGVSKTDDDPAAGAARYQGAAP